MWVGRELPKKKKKTQKKTQKKSTHTHSDPCRCVLHGWLIRPPPPPSCVRQFQEQHQIQTRISLRCTTTLYISQGMKSHGKLTHAASCMERKDSFFKNLNLQALAMAHVMTMSTSRTVLTLTWSVSKKKTKHTFECLSALHFSCSFKTTRNLPFCFCGWRIANV